MANAVDELLESLGVTYDELTPDEKHIYSQWYSDLEKRELTMSDIKQYVSDLCDVVCNEMSVPNLTKNQDLYLKARLKNYVLFKAFLSTPERAKKALEQDIRGKIR
jgi:hypothetical protein